ncbi:MAG: VOC family protein [Comamonadaceae bacterium]|nr:MAG: VOC family protein [Comamonadaceae bacterium]
MSPINAYLTFDGNAAQAMRFYEQVLNGKLEMMMTMGEMPGGEGQKMPADQQQRIMHAALSFGGGMLMASDTMCDSAPYEGMKGFGVAVSLPSAAEAKRVFDAFADGGTVQMPLEPTFWAEVFGMVVDRFGTPWLVNGPDKSF